MPPLAAAQATCSLGRRAARPPQLRGRKMVIANAAGLSAPAGNQHSHSTQEVRPRVFIVSDVRLLCDGLTLSLSQQPSLMVVGSADPAFASARLADLHPHVVLLDVGSPRGLDMPPLFRQVLPDVKIVAIAVNDVEQEVFACADARVSGFVSRNGSLQDLVAAIHCAMRNELVCSPRVAALLFGRFATLRSEPTGERINGGLTQREHEIVSLMTRGLSNKEIARQLRIQNATVKNHIHSILGKLQVRRRGEVAARMESGASSHRRPLASPDLHLAAGVGAMSSTD
jgi:two-component system, NarL family, nitrate/nitrite response regulator NarL